MKKKIELLAPAGDLKKLKYAFEYGADAIYCGLPDFSLRSMIRGFNFNTLKQGIEYAHQLNKKVYLTLNIYPHEKQLKKLPAFIKKIKPLKPDALIISDPGILLMLKKAWPSVKIHLSTQANCTNWQAAKFWFENGVTRIILARETTLKDIKEIHEKVPKVELEYFVHGAMCVSYSGRCLLSSWFNDRSANLGACTQPCRWNYKLFLQEDKRPNNFFPIEQDKNGTYIMNSKDLCLIEDLEKLKRAGVTSFKIEGRAKSFYYVALAVSAYRQALDKKESFKNLKKDLGKLPNRGFTTGFVFGKETVEQRFESSHSECEWELCGEVVGYESTNQLRMLRIIGYKSTNELRMLRKSDKKVTNYKLITNPAARPAVRERRGRERRENATNIIMRVKVHNSMKVGDEIELIQPNGKKLKMKIKIILDKDYQKIPSAHGGQDNFVYLPIKQDVPAMSLLRKKLKIRFDKNKLKN